MDSALLGEFVQQQWLLFFSLFIIIFMIIQTYFGDKMAGYASVSPEQAVRLINDGAFVLDVRSVDEYRTGHLNVAKNISIADLAQKLESLNEHKEGPTLVYCESGMRSARACGMLIKAGFKNISNLSGGISSWRSANLPLAKHNKKGK
jgi:rhodanese-related sulfurtransferase